MKMATFNSGIEGPKKDMGSKKPLVNLEHVLECTICLDVSASPIHNCGNGHIICGICIEKVKKCGQCGLEDLQVSKLAERLSRQFGIDGECDNYGSGCTGLIRYADIKDHVKECEYRNIKCFGSFTFGSCLESIPMKLYWQHLKDVHMHSEVINGNSGFFKLQSKACEDLTPHLISFDGNSFIWYFAKRHELVYWWVAILGGQREASNYQYETRLVPMNKQAPFGATCIWKLPVLPFHGHDIFKSSKEESYANATFASLSKFFAVKSANGIGSESTGLELILKISHIKKDPGFNLQVTPTLCDFEFKSVPETSTNPFREAPRSQQIRRPTRRIPRT